MKINVELNENDIKRIEIDDHEYSDSVGYDAYISFDVDDTYEVINDEDKIIIKVRGKFENEGFHEDGDGRFEGSLYISAEDLLESYSKKIIPVNNIYLSCTFGGNNTFNVDTSRGLSYNLEQLIETEEPAFRGNFESNFKWIELLDNESLQKELIPVLNDVLNDNFNDLNTEELVDKLNELDVIDVHEYCPTFNEEYDNNIGKVIMSYFAKDWDGYVPELDESFSLNEDDIKEARVYLY